MGKIKLHWWILLGMMVGVVTGTLINQAYIDEARETVLGSGYSEATPQQLQENAQNINEELRRRVIATPIGAGIEGLSRIFMSLLKMIVLPLVFFSLVLGISGMKEAKRLGRIGIKTGAWYVPDQSARHHHGPGCGESDRSRERNQRFKFPHRP